MKNVTRILAFVALALVACPAREDIGTAAPIDTERFVLHVMYGALVELIVSLAMRRR